MNLSDAMTDDVSFLLFVRQVLDHDPFTGRLTWKQSLSPRVRVGDVAGLVGCHGYRRVRLCGKEYRAHRLCWFHYYGRWPDDCLDHVNGNRDDNRLANLRECSQAQNLQNKGLDRRNKSGFTGVYWDEKRGKYFAQITASRKTRSLGRFDTAEQAAAAHAAAKAQLHTFNPVAR